MKVEERFTDDEICIATDMCDMFQVSCDVSDDGEHLEIDGGGISIYKYSESHEEGTLSGSATYIRTLFVVFYDYIEHNYPHEPNWSDAQKHSHHQFLLDAIKSAILLDHEWELNNYIESQIDYDGIFGGRDEAL